jgi:hypothetical protein
MTMMMMMMMMMMMNLRTSCLLMQSWENVFERRIAIAQKPHSKYAAPPEEQGT